MLLFIFVLALAGPFRAAAQPASLQTLLNRITDLAAHKQLAEAERLARVAVDRFPHSRDARLALSRVLLWQGKYSEARKRFGELLTANSRDVESRLGLAQAEYWSGDYRGAEREFARVLRQQPRNAEAARSLAEIRAASRPGFNIGVAGVSDDQPYHEVATSVEMYGFIDPLTRWSLSGSASRVRTSAKSAQTSSIGSGLDTTLPLLRLTFHGSGSLFRFPDGTSQFLPSAAAEKKIASTVLSFSVGRHALLRSAPALLTHPSATSISMRWSRDITSRQQFAIHAEHLRFFDRNDGVAADAYLLVPLPSRGPLSLSIGVSTAYRDTAESRFRGGVYDPYWTPQDLREARAIASATWHDDHVTVGIHLDGGAARDRLVTETIFTRTFHPWRAATTASLTFSSGLTLNVVAEHNTTVFYSANEFSTSVAGRF